MKKMHLIYGFVVCSALFFSGCNKNQIDASSEGSDQDGQDTEYVQPVIWTGPGWYSGVWFSTEIDFNNWNHHHYHRRDRDHHDRYNEHHDRHRDAGERGGGNRGGSHSRPRSDSGGHQGGGGGGHREKGHK
jgi:hypothetical protein